MKKTLAVLLVILTLLSLCACGNSTDIPATEDDKYLPYGLKFGMKYKATRKVWQDMPEIKDAQSNGGYSSDPHTPSYSDYQALFGINSQSVAPDGDTISNPEYYFNFNKSKELCEFQVITRISDNERAAEDLLNAYLDHYNESVGVEAEINETDTMISGLYVTETLKITVSLAVEGDNFTVGVIIHNKAYGLSN